MRSAFVAPLALVLLVPMIGASEPDSDGDGSWDVHDVCVDVYDPAQVDGDQDGIGDACDAESWYALAFYAFHPRAAGGLGGWQEDGTGRLPLKIVEREEDDWFAVRLVPVCCGIATLTHSIEMPAVGKVSVDWSFVANTPYGGEAAVRAILDDGSSVRLTWTAGEAQDELAISPVPGAPAHSFARVIPDHWHDYRAHLVLDFEADTFRAGVLDMNIYQPDWLSSASFPLAESATRIVALQLEAMTLDGSLYGFYPEWSVWDIRVHVDADEDGMHDALDICPNTPAMWHEDEDGDGVGDECDADNDNDGVEDVIDNCDLLPNPDQADLDGDGLGDGCDADLDGDGAQNAIDNCAAVPNADQANADGDAMGNACDPDDDNDLLPDTSDNCALIANPAQEDLDADGAGDVCDPDDDNDAVLDVHDNCASLSNPAQENADGDAQGDACDPDDDNDGVLDLSDNCALTPNPAQTNTDHDATGDACDEDDDNDGVLDAHDNCRIVPNALQEDFEGDGLGDVCDPDDDNDALADADEAALGTDPRDADSDDEGLADGAEVHTHRTDPLDPDTDGDLFSDATEVEAGSDATNPTGIPVGPARQLRIGALDGAEAPTDGIRPVA